MSEVDPYLPAIFVGFVLSMWYLANVIGQYFKEKYEKIGRK